MTNDGRQLEYIEEQVGTFFLSWLPAIMESEQSINGISLIIALVKYNSAYLDEQVVHGFVKEVVSRMMRADTEDEILKCLQALNAVVAYSYLPTPAFSLYISALARIVSCPRLV